MYQLCKLYNILHITMPSTIYNRNTKMSLETPVDIYGKNYSHQEISINL